MNPSRHLDPVGLPALLAEYGDLAAQLPAASRVYADWIRSRLAELDARIDHYRAAGTLTWEDATG